MDGYQSSLPLVLIPPINPFTYVIKWIEFTSADKAALKQKSYHHLSCIPCLKPLQQRLEPYQLLRHHPQDHLNSYILPHSKTYWNWKIIYLTNLTKQDSTEHHNSLLWILCQHISLLSPMPNQLHDTPIPIIKESLDHDVQWGIITPVQIGTPVEWCSPMVVTSKKDGTPQKKLSIFKT